MLTPKPTTEDVKTYRDEHECSLFYARQELNTRWRRENLQRIRKDARRIVTLEASHNLLVDLLDLIIEVEHE